MKKYTHEKAHEEIDYIFKTLLPQRGMAERPEQIRLCHSILDAMLDGSIALCDAGTGIGKTFAYLTAGILHGKCRAAEGKPQRPIRDLILPSEITLNIGISTAKAISRMSASQKLGTHIPIMQITLVAWSNALSFHMTENADIKTVKIATQSIDIITNIHVTGRAFLILSMTGFRLVIEIPKSPVSSPFI